VCIDTVDSVDFKCGWGGEGSERAKMENFCDVILVAFFGDVIVMASLK